MATVACVPPSSRHAHRRVRARALLRPLGVRRRAPAVRVRRRGLADGRAAGAGRRRDARAVGRPPARLHGIAGPPAPARARSPPCTTPSSPTRCSSSPAPRRRSSASPTSLLGPGDHAIVTWPGYQSLYEVARATGADVTPPRAARGDGWALDVDRVRAQVTPETRLIVVNAPHNPTGMLPDRADVRRARRDRRRDRRAPPCRRGLPVPRVRRGRPSDRPAPTRSRGASRSACMSKSFAMAGLRIGWLASHDRELLARATAFKDYTTICSSAPAEILGSSRCEPRTGPCPLARDRRGQPRAARPVLRRWVRRVRVGSSASRLDRLPAPDRRRASRSTTWPRSWSRPRASCSCPGSRFGYPGNHFRIGFGRRDLPVAPRAPRGLRRPQARLGRPRVRSRPGSADEDRDLLDQVVAETLDVPGLDGRLDVPIGVRCPAGQDMLPGRSGPFERPASPGMVADRRAQLRIAPSAVDGHLHPDDRARARPGTAARASTALRRRPGSG